MENCSKHINARISQAKQNMVHLNNIWKDHSLPLQLKLKILKCLICPVMMYGCAAWTLIKADEKKIEAAEMWFYRRLLRVKCTEKRTNQSVSKEIGSPKQMLETINVRKLKYVGHICRHTDTGLMLNVLQGKTQSARKGEDHQYLTLKTSKRVWALICKTSPMRVRTGIDGVILWIEHHVGQQPSQPMMLTDDR